MSSLELTYSASFQNKTGVSAVDTALPRTWGSRYAAPAKAKAKAGHPGLQQGRHHLRKAAESTQLSWVEAKGGAAASSSVDSWNRVNASPH